MFKFRFIRTGRTASSIGATLAGLPRPTSVAGCPVKWLSPRFRYYSAVRILTELHSPLRLRPGTSPQALHQFDFQNLLPFYPQPNASPATFVSTQTKATYSDQFGVRLDHYLTPRDTLNFGYIFREGNILDPLSTSGANVPGFPVGEEHRAQNFVVTETQTFYPSLVGLARVSFLRDYLWRVFSLSRARFSSSSFCPASPSLPSAVRRW